MALASGTKLGPYEIVAPLGAGGMGEVYRARDSRLGRDVAVKVLPEHLSSSAEVRTRFEREARTVSSLNHPHICVLHDVGRDGDTDYLVMELIEGETLAKRLERGALPIGDVLRLGSQIADALDRAHRAGIVHRDLKPGNVMVTKSGAKLMDFGLARATGLGGPDGSKGADALAQSPTMSRQITAEGSIVGTFQYMAPEQLEGAEPDTRSDLWALGCVLYEMATGARAFEGKSQASLIGNIMNSQPAPISSRVPMSPPAFERLVKQCLARDPDERWQSAGDVRRELQWIGGTDSQSGAQAVSARRKVTPKQLFPWIAVAITSAAATWFGIQSWKSQPASSLMRFAILPPLGTSFTQPAEAELSPDGTQIVFVARDTANTVRLYVRSLSSPEARVLPGTENANLPFWSPDGVWLAFFSDGKMRKVSLDGASPSVLCDAPDARGGNWSKEGILFAPGNQGPIVRVSANGGSPVPVSRVNTELHEKGHRYPQMLPDGKHFMYVAIGSGDDVSTFVQPLEGGTPVEVCKAGSGARWTKEGYLLYLDTGVNSPKRRLLARPFDLDKLRTFGDAQLLVDNVNASNFGYANVTTDSRGSLLVQHWGNPHARLIWRDRQGKDVGTALEDIVTQEGSLNPAATQLAYSGLDTRDIFLLDFVSKVSTRLTFENRRISNLAWSHDGKVLAFSRLSAAHGWEAYTKATDGTGADSLLFRAPGLFSFPQCWSSDDRWLVAACSDSTGKLDLYRIPMDGHNIPELYQHTPGDEKNAVLSPDGKWIAYLSVEEGKTLVYVQSFPNPGATYQVTIEDAVQLKWPAPGDELIVETASGTVRSVQISTAGGFRQGATSELFRLATNEFVGDVSMDGKRFLSATTTEVSTLSQLEIVLGWTQLLDKSH